MNAPRTTSPSGSAAFTLVEMLMAMLVMTVGLLGLLQAVNLAYQQGTKTRLRSEAVQLAEERMHAWSGISFDRISTNTEMTSTETKLVGGVPWNYRVTRMAQPAGATVRSVKKLSVEVTWSLRGETASHEIYTLRTRRVGE